MWLSKSINRSCYVQAGYVGEDVESILYKLLTVILTSLFTYLHHNFFFENLIYSENKIKRRDKGELL